MIFAAGLGTRLKPLTDTLPKALVPVGGRPLIEHVCRKLMCSGIDSALVNVHHFADDVQAWIDSQDWICTEENLLKEGRMLVQTSDERKMLLETGGAVLNARRYLEGCGMFLVHNVDILSDLDIRWFASQVKDGAVATLLVSGRKSSRQLLFDPQTMMLKGWHNLSTGEIRSPYRNLDPSGCLSFAFSGIHIMSDRILGLLETYAREQGLYDNSQMPRFSIIDFYLWACAGYGIQGVFADNLRLIDVGKLDTLALAEEFILTQNV